MKSVTKKDLGKRIGTTYLVSSVSLTEHEKGWAIKPVKQKPIYITKSIGHFIAEYIRDRKVLFRMKEARDIIKGELVDEL